MTCSIRTFSTYLNEVDRLLEEMPPLSALDGCVRRLAKVLGFDSAWYGFLGWETSSAGNGVPSNSSITGPVMHGTASLNLPGDFYQTWQAMSHEDLLLDQIRKAPRRVATYLRSQSVQTDGMLAMVDRYGIGSIATATQIRTDHQGSLFLACLRHGGSSVRRWHSGERDFLYASVEVLDRQIRQRADVTAATIGEGVELLVSAAGHCVFGGAGLLALGMDAEGPVRDKLQAAMRTALKHTGRLVADDLGLVITAKPAKVDDGAGLRRVHVRPLSPVSRLSPREAEVAALLTQGLSHKHVARHLGISPATVRNQTSQIYDKLRVHNRATLASVLVSSSPDRSSPP
ncbi:MAG: LuxR C-terminal-related transcriptional regulator [Gammaproteobacteria bacterium]|nr:LuxR C-terminal-related transcriptional regulator [Gammaproteobacteria bacterium]MBU1352032.1 LuxR C-terminal-related transcriptional regulator [Gammaproteobacteria bacterium]MBU1507651.1 LuxR C-terminal-related transcriptional regulator [Gammaproteobacteria bacterium]MBU2119376.1 LuxR C-terminal-related transcriptional regulator [Gammaproteobacteria bacterium]MBU2172353.1 LuxR C-terminal-related transcriptional regulator [Gammaproteobacteria bacterium]